MLQLCQKPIASFIMKIFFSPLHYYHSSVFGKKLEKRETFHGKIISIMKQAKEEEEGEGFEEICIVQKLGPSVCLFLI